MPSKVAHNWPQFFFQYCQPAQNQPKSHFLFHKNVYLRDFYKMTLEGPNISRTFIEVLGRNKSKDACKIVVLGTRPSLVATYVWRQFELEVIKILQKRSFRCNRLHLIYNLHVIHACIMCRFAHRSVHTRQICLCTLHSHMLLVASNLQPTHMYHACMYHVQICTKMSTRQICLCTVELLNPIIFKFSEK